MAIRLPTESICLILRLTIKILKIWEIANKAQANIFIKLDRSGQLFIYGLLYRFYNGSLKEKWNSQNKTKKNS